MKITKHLTKVNFTKGTNRRIEYLVIHWVGAISTAKNNALYFEKEYRAASAHYFVDNNNIYQVVEDKDIAWHCGTTGKYVHASCRNSNSIGIEMCVSKGMKISDQTKANTIYFIKQLQKKYNICDSKVIRHYDVTGKLCPAPMIDSEKWSAFKAKLKNKPPKPIILSSIKYGSQGIKVKKLQRLLNWHGYGVSVDGIFGTYTRNAVIDFQKKSKLPVNGIVSKMVWEVL